MFLHGYLSDSSSFVYQTSVFSEHFSVYAPDLKGFGKNGGMEKAYSLDDYCKDVLEYIKENQMEKPCVIAHSFGGRIAIKLASKYPDLFDKIVLTGSAGLKPRFSLKRWVKKLVFKILKKFVKKERLEKFYSNDYRALWPVMKESFIKIVNEQLDDKLNLIKNQVLIINGVNDKETPVYMAKRLAKGIKNSRLILIKNAGHFCFIDNKRKFNTEVKEFLLL